MLGSSAKMFNSLAVIVIQMVGMRRNQLLENVVDESEVGILCFFIKKAKLIPLLRVAVNLFLCYSNSPTDPDWVFLHHWNND